MPSLQSYFFRFCLRNLISSRLKNASIEQLRLGMERSVRRARLPAGVSTQATLADEVPAEWVWAEGAREDTAVLYLHGGGFVCGSINTHRVLAAYLSRACRARLLLIDYRLAPEHPFPAGLEDCLAAYRWLLARGFSPHRLGIAGDSAGGNLALATLLALRAAGDPLPAAAVCLSPATDLAGTGESILANARLDPLLSQDACQEWVTAYLPDKDWTLPLVSPLYADLHGLPPLLVHVGSDEILYSDATRLVERAREQEVDATLVIWPHLWHVFHAMVPYLPEALRAVDAVGDFLGAQWERRASETYVQVPQNPIIL